MMQDKNKCLTDANKTTTKQQHKTETKCLNWCQQDDHKTTMIHNKNKMFNWCQQEICKTMTYNSLNMFKH